MKAKAAIVKPNQTLILVVFLLLNAIDLGLTAIALSMGCSEANPVLTYASPTIAGVLISKSTLAFFMGISLHRLNALRIMNAVSIGLALVCIWNLIVIGGLI